jgi:hypothetical protein
VRAALDLQIAGDGAHAFVRLCDVDPTGTSRNVCDGIVAVPPGHDAYSPAGGVLTVELAATAHCFAPGHRLRVQVSGGAFPRFARSTGTWEPVATAVRLMPLTSTLRHTAASALTLPVVDGGP